MDRLGYWVYQLARALAGWVSLPVLCRMGSALGTCAYFLLPAYRRLALRNLEIAFGNEIPASRRRKLAREHFAALGSNLLGALGVTHLTAEQVREVTTFEGMEHLHRVLESGQGIVYVISHLGNWELLAQAMPLIIPAPCGTIYQRLGNPLIDAEVRAARARFGKLQLFERKEGFQGALRMLREKGVVGILADQHAGDAGVWCPFFGRLASTTSLPATLAMRSGAAICGIAVYTTAPGRWRLVARPPIVFESRDVGEATVLVNRELEASIRVAPADWFWVHNRWKTPKPKFLLATYKRGVVASARLGARQPFRIAIRSTNWLGDAVMAVPAVRAIKAGRPDAHVTVVSPAKLAHIWRAVPEVDEVIEIAPGDTVWTVARALRGKFEVIILLPNSLRAGLEGWVAGIPRRVGYAGHRRVWLLNQVYREKRKKAGAAPAHQVHHYLKLAAACGADLEAGKQASQARVLPDRLQISVCPGAEYGPAKRWLPERFAEVIRSVSSLYACDWALLGVAKDAPIAVQIATDCGVEVRNLTGRTTLDELVAELRQSALLLTNDTGTMHLAALLGVPVVAIFGSTEPSLTGPLGEGHQILRRHVECSPCYLRECPLDFRCMKAVEAIDAVRAIGKILGPGSAKAPLNSQTSH